jgi:hypothetical protein
MQYVLFGAIGAYVHNLYYKIYVVRNNYIVLDV